VLFVHGITTSCLEVGAIAHRMVERGRRVMALVSNAFDNLICLIISSLTITGSMGRRLH
jgi:hypothetical protein